MFHVYNKFDTIDAIHVSASTAEEAIELAVKDGFLVGVLGVQERDLVAMPFSFKCQTSDFVRRINSSGVVLNKGASK